MKELPIGNTSMIKMMKVNGLAAFQTSPEVYPEQIRLKNQDWMVRMGKELIENVSISGQIWDGTQAP